MADLTIHNLEELKAFRDRVNSGESFSGQTVVLAADIDLKNEEWTPIGNSSKTFQGNFDGQGHTVSNLKITGNKSYVGFFGFTTNGSVSNLTIENASVSGRLGVGVVAGSPYTSKYTNIKVTGHVEVEGMAYVGGVGGRNAYADWTDITVDVDETSFVKADSVEWSDEYNDYVAYRTYVGGVIGFVAEGGHTLKNITSNINVEGSTCDVGGIAGIAHYQNNFENVSCTAKEIVVNGDDAEVGAIAGVWMDSSVGDVTMIDCTVSENTKVYKTVTDGENAVKTEVDALNGASYNGSTAGELLTATKTTDSYGAVALEITKVDGTGAKRDISESEVKKVAAADTGAASFIVGDYDVAGYEGSNVVMDADGKIVGGSFTATESADSAAFSAALSENVQQQTDGSIANLSMISVDDDYATLTEGTVIAPGIIFGVNAFATIQDAVKAATDGATIVIKGGTYDENIILTPEAVGTAAKDLTFKAATGEQVDFKGLFQCGLYVNQTSNVSSWNGEIVLEGINFINDGVNTNLDFQSSGNVTVKDCTFSAGANYSDDDSLINFVSGCNTMLVTFDGCDFTGGRVNSGGQSVVYNSCTFTDCKTNIQHGVETTYNDCDFMVTITDAANNDNFYVIRTNDIAVNINGGSVTVDANVSDGTVPGSKVWAVFWQRTAGATKWNVADLTVKYTDKANDLGVLVFNNNVTSTAANAMDRATFDNTVFYVGDTKVDNSELFLSSIGYVISGDALYYNGDVFALNKFAVNSSYTTNGSVVEVNGEKYLVGVNAFASLKDAADKAVDGTVIEITGEGTTKGTAFVNGGTVTLTGDAILNWSESQFYIGRAHSGEALDSTLVIKDAKLDSSSNSTGNGIHVSGAKLNSTTTKDGKLIIENSEVTTDYLTVKNEMTVIGDGNYNDGEVDLYAKSGLGLMGRGAGESADGTDKTAVLNITKGAYFHLGSDANYGIGAWNTNNDDAYGVLNISDSKFVADNDLHIRRKGKLDISGSDFEVKGTLTIEKDENFKGYVKVADSKFVANKVVNSADAFDVYGKSTILINTLEGDTVNFRDGAVISGSTIGGSVFVAGNVTFKGDNQFAMLYDFGTLQSYYGTTADMEWTVDAGASVKLTNDARYGLGYGDKVTVNGQLDSAAAARAKLNNGEEVFCSFNPVGGVVCMTNGSYSYTSSYFTVNDAYVNLGKNGTKSFGSDASGYGTFVIEFNNAVVDANRFTFYNNNTVVQLSVTNSDILLGSQLMTKDADSVFTFTNSTVTVKNPNNGSEEDNVNGGTLNLINSKLIYADAGTETQYENNGALNVKSGALMDVSNLELVNSGTITVDALSSIKAISLTNNGAIIIDASGFTGGVKKVIDLNGTAALDVAGVTFTNVAAGVNTVFGADGDVTLVKADQSMIYVNTDYSSQEAVDNALGGAYNGMYFGGNAFNSIAEAVKNTTDRNPLNITFTGSETVASTGITHISNEKSTFDIDGRTTTISGINNTAEALWVDLNEDMDSTAAETLLTIENAKLNVAKLKADNNAVLNVNNSELDFEDGFNNNIYSKNSGEIHVANSVLNNLIQVSAYGKLTITDSEVNSGTATNVNGGTMSVSGSQYKFRTIGVRGGGVLNVTDSVLQSKDMLTSNETQNKTAVSEVSNENQIIIAVENGGTLNLKDSEVVLNKVQYWDALNGKYVDTHTEKITVAENGVVNMEDSSLTVDKVINSGDFNVSGVSQLNIGTLTGKVELNGATLTDSVIGGGAGDVHAYGNVIVENATFNNNTGNRSGLTVMGGTTELRGDISAIELGTQHARDTGVEKVLVIGENANVSVGYTGENDGEDLKVGFLYARNDAEIIVEKGGNLYLNGQLSNRGTITLKGNMVVAGVNGVGAIHLAGAGSQDEYGTMNIVGGTLSDRQTSHVNANDLYTVTDMKIGDDGDTNSVVNVTEGGKIATTNSYWDILADGELNVTDGSVDIDAPTNNPGVGVSWIPRDYVMTNAGKIAISNSKFDVVSLNNSGDFNVSGVSQLNIGTLTGTVDISGATIKDSNVGGEAVVIDDEVVFKGDNVIGSIDHSNATVTVGAGDSLKLTTGRGIIKNDTKFNITGEISDALTADKAGLKASYDVDGISITGSGELNVNNAYVKLSSSQIISNKNYLSGVAALNFTNSVVDIKTLQILEAANGKVNTTFDGSVGNFSQYIKNTDADSVFTAKNGSVINSASSFMNDGEFNVLSGSTVNVAYYTNSSHGRQTGTLTVDGENSKFILKAASNDQFNNTGKIYVTGGALLDINYINNSGTINVSGAEAVVSAGSIDTFGDITLTNGAELNVAGKITTDANTEVVVDDAKVVISGTYTNKGSLIVSDSEFSAGTLTTIAGVTTEFTDVALNLGTVVSDGEIFIGGTSTLNIDNFGGYYSLRLKDGVELVNSTINGSSGWWYRVLGSATINNVTTNGQFDIKGDGNFVVKGDLNTPSIYFSANNTIDGDDIYTTALVMQSAHQILKSDIYVDGADNTIYAPVYFTNTTADIYGTICQTNSRGEVIYVNNSTVNVHDGGKLQTTSALNIYGGELRLNFGGEAQAKNMTVYAGQSMVVDGGKLVVSDTLTNNGYLTLMSDKDNTVGNFINEKSDTGNAMIFDAKLTVSGDFTNHGQLDISNSTLIVDGKFFNDYDGVTISGSTVRINKLENDNQLFIDGKNTIQIEDATGSSFAFRANDGVVLNDSYVKATDNATLRALGSLTINGGFTGAYFQTKGSSGTVTVNGTLDLTCGVGSLEINNDYTFNGGKIVTSGDAYIQSGTITLNNDLDCARHLRFSGSTVTLKGNVAVVESNQQHMLALRSATVTVDGGVLSSCDYISLGFYDYVTSGEYGKTDYASTLKAVNGGTISMVNNLFLNTGSKVSLDYTSKLIFGGSIVAQDNAEFTIDTTGYTDGSYKVLDYTGTGSMDYSFVSGFGTDDKLIVIDNDLYVSDADRSIIYVDEKYQVNGEVVDGKIVGYNAYSSFYNDGANWNDYADYFNGVEKFVLTAGNTTSYGNLRCSAYDNPTITIETVGSGAALINRLMVAGASNKCSVIIAEGSYIQVLNTGKESFVNPESTLTIKGTLEVNATKAAGSSWRTYGSTSTQPGHTIVAETGKLIFNGGQVYNTGTMTVYGEMQINAEYNDAFAKLAGDETGKYASDFYIIGGSVNVDQRAFSIGGGWGSNWGEPLSGEANFSITDGGKFTSSAVVFRGGTSAVLTIDNSSMTFGNRADGSAWTGTGGGDYVSTYDGTINLTAGTLNLGVIDFVNNGVITMNGGEFTATSVANAGTITVSGTSKLNIGTLTGNAVRFTDGANISESSIGGDVRLFTGTHNWSGTNKVTGIFSLGYYEAEGSITLNVTGDFTVGNMLSYVSEGRHNVINIGSADGARTKFAATTQLGIFENSTVNVNNADVTYHYTFIRGAFNVKNSTMTIDNGGVNTYFSGNAVVTVDNSVWTAGSYSCLGSYNGGITAMRM